MNRKLKNLAFSLLIAAMVVATGTAMYIAASQNSSSMDMGSGGMSMEMPGGSQGGGMDQNSNSNGQGTDNSPNSDSSQNADNGNAQTISTTQDSNSSQPPDLPSDNGQGGSDSNAAGNSQGGMGQGGSQQMDQQMGSQGLGFEWYLLFGVLSLVLAAAVIYMIASRGNWYSWKATTRSKGKIAICLIATIVVAGGLTVGEALASTHILPNLLTGQEQEEDSDSVEATGATEVTDTQSLDGDYSSKTEDESTILVKDGGALTLSDATLTKSGDSSNTENSEFNGINAGLLVTKSSTATISGAKITTSATGSNAVFSTGEDSKITITDSTITTTGDSSARGLDATYGGYIEGSKLTIKTQGNSCATLATDRGEGTVKVSSSKLSTKGSGSPVIYSTGDISIEDTTGTASGSQMVVVEGKNSATVTSSKLSASGIGNRNNVDDGGIMIYQSMSGDASEGTGTFTATDSTLTIDEDSSVYSTAPMFFLTNTDGVINLTNTELSYGSNVLIKAIATDEWGNSGSNGANVTLNASSQSLVGDVILDSISTLTMNLEESTYKGAINGDNSASSVTLKLDKKSKITLTGDSYVAELDDADSSYSNINFNGHKLYVNGKAIN